MLSVNLAILVNLMMSYTLKASNRRARIFLWLKAADAESENLGSVPTSATDYLCDLGQVS